MNLTVYQTLAALHHSQGYTTCLVKNSIHLCGPVRLSVDEDI